MSMSTIASGRLAAAATILAANADIVSSRPINATVNLGSTYTMSITEGGSTHSWEIGIVQTGPFATSSSFTPTNASTGVGAITLTPLQVHRYVFEDGSGAEDFFNTIPTGGTANHNRTLHRYTDGSGMFPAFGVNQYAGFCFDASRTTYFGWASFTVAGPNSVTMDDFAYGNGSIGAGMVIPAPGAIAPLGLVGLVEGRRRA
jgi:hypothetical protein